jgi:geranylgeranyl reductase
MNLILGCDNVPSEAGATVVPGVFKSLEYQEELVSLTYQTKDENPRTITVTARSVLGADGARSAVARATIPDAEKTPWVLAYHEIIEVPEDQNWAAYDPDRCDVWYQGRLSPDFYAWVFPHGKNASIGSGQCPQRFLSQSLSRGAACRCRISRGDDQTQRRRPHSYETNETLG